MMAEKIMLKCPKCRRPIQVDEQLAGLFIRCPYCEESILIPPDATPQTAADAASSAVSAQTWSAAPLVATAAPVRKNAALEKEPEDEEPDTMAMLSLVCGGLSLLVIVAGVFVAGFVLYPLAILLGVGGLILGVLSQGNLKVAGIALNGVMLGPAVILLASMVAGAMGRSPTATTNGPSLPTTVENPQTPQAELPKIEETPPPNVDPPPSTSPGPGTKSPTRTSPAEEAARQRQALLEVFKPGQAWNVPIPDRDGSPVDYQFTMLSQDAETGSVAVLAQRVGDPFERALFNGKIETGYSGGSLFRRPGAADFNKGWYLAMRPRDRGPRLTAFGLGTMLALYLPPGSDKVAAAFQNEKLPATPAAADEEGSAAFFEKLKEAAAPGTQWVGSGQQGNQASTEVMLTFVDFRDEGRYVRVVAEPQDNPNIATVYEGSVRIEGAEAQAWPINVLKKETTNRGTTEPLLAAGDDRLYLTLLADGGMIGTIGNERLRLRRSPDKIKVEGFVDRAKAAVAPGTRWSGKVAVTGQSGRKLEITFTEVRDDGSYVRALITSADSPSSAAVYKGRLQLDDTNQNASFLTLKEAHTAADHGASHPFFAKAAVGISGQQLLLRLSFDGAEMYGATSSGETMQLTREEVDPPLTALAEQDRAELIKKKLAKGAQWTGTLENRKFGQSIDANLQVSEVSDDGLTLQVIVTSSKARGTKIILDGRLLLDDDNRLDGYAVELKKTVGGRVNGSPIFSGDPNARLLLRLSLNGENLYGLATFNMPVRYEEVLELTRKDGK